MMKQLVIGLAVAGVLALPAAAAHLVWAIPVEQEDGTIKCEIIWIGSPDLPPHGVGGVQPCIPPSHSAQPTLP